MSLTQINISAKKYIELHKTEKYCKVFCIISKFKKKSVLLATK